MAMKGSLITLLILTFPYVLFAQTGIIRGTVTVMEEDGSKTDYTYELRRR